MHSVKFIVRSQATADRIKFLLPFSYNSYLDKKKPEQPYQLIEERCENDVNLFQFKLYR